MLRRGFFGSVAAGALAPFSFAQERPEQAGADGVFLEGPASGQPHKGKVLLALQAHSDDIPLPGGRHGRQAD